MKDFKELKMNRQWLITGIGALLASTLGCGGPSLDVSELEVALSTDLPGCEVLQPSPAAATAWELFPHPADPALTVVTRDGCAVCIDSPSGASAHLQRVGAEVTPDAVGIPTLSVSEPSGSPFPPQGEPGPEQKEPEPANPTSGGPALSNQGNQVADYPIPVPRTHEDLILTSVKGK